MTRRMDLQLLLLLLPLFPLVRSNLEYHGDRRIEILDQKEPSKQRIWSFTEGEFLLVDPGDVLELELGPEDVQTSGFKALNKERRRRKRWMPKPKLEGPKLLELAVFFDEDLWRLYLDKYGEEEAEPRLRIFADVMLNTTRSLLQDLSPRLDMSILRFEIWKEQPRPLQYFTAEVSEYVPKFCSFVQTKSSGFFDHATLISGKELKKGLVEIVGSAWQNAMCSENTCSCSVVRGTFEGAYRLGNTLAHEIGHSLGMDHDSEGKARDCDPRNRVMEPGQTGIHWSKCSNEAYQKKLERIDCLNYHLTPPKPLNGHVDNLPGQVFPDEAQCHQILGTCFRNVPGYESDCRKHHCTSQATSTNMKTIDHYRLDGTYCGPGKICDGSECIPVNTQLQTVHGGWSEWGSDVENACGGRKCSNCHIHRQQSLRVEVRRCDAPYPNNGGRPCMGAQIRGVKCTRWEKPQTCQQSSSSLDCKGQYMRSKCIILNSTQCDFTCPNDSNPILFPDGTPCGSGEFIIGRCVQGVCMYPMCQDSNYYVSSELDCAC